MLPELPLFEVAVSILAPLVMLKSFALTKISPAVPFPDVDAETRTPSVRVSWLVVKLIFPALPALSISPVVSTASLPCPAM